jgi:hypothetical protein
MVCGADELVTEGELTAVGFNNFSNWTSYSGWRVWFGDDYRQASGSASLNDAKVTEGLNAYQGSLHIIYRTDYSSADTVTRYLFDGGAVEVYWNGASTQWTAVVNGVTINRTDTFSAGDEIYLYLSWDSNAPTLDLDADGTSAAQVTSAQTVGAVLADPQIGADQNQTSHASGLIAWRVSESIESSLYDSGDGDADFFVVTPDVLQLSLATDDDTGKVGFHKGKFATDVNGYTVTTATGADTSFVAADEGTLEDGTGYNRPVVMSTITGATTVEVEGAGGALEFNEDYYSSAADNTKHDITTQDIGIGLWINVPTDRDGIFQVIMEKIDAPNAGYALVLRADHLPRMIIEAGDGDNYYFEATTTVNDGVWHHIVVIVDKSNSANCGFYIDNGSREFGRTNGTLADIGSLTNTSILQLARRANDTYKLDAKVSNIFLSYPADIMAVGELGASGEIANLMNGIGDRTNWPNREDSWLCDEGTGTTLTGENENLTLSNASAWARGIPDPNIAKVGVSLDFDGAVDWCTNSSQLVAAYPFSLAVWFHATGNGCLISLGDISSSVRYFALRVANGALSQLARNTTNYDNIGTTNVLDGRWHHAVAVFTDATTREVFLDGVSEGTDVNNVAYSALIDAVLVGLLRTVSQTGEFDGQISEAMVVSFALPDADILYLATHPGEDIATIVANTTLVTGDIEAKYDFRNQNLLDETANSYDLTHNDTASYTTEARLSRNLLLDIENGGIGGHTAVDAATVLSKSTTQIDKNDQSLKVENSDASQAFDRFTIPTIANQDYLFRGRFYPPATPNGASQLVDVDTTAALGITVTQANLTGSQFNTVEFCFTAADNSTTIDLGSGSATNAEFGYWDDVMLMENLITNGGMESFQGGDPNIPTGWVNVLLDPGEMIKAGSGEGDTERHSGDFCAKFVSASTNERIDHAVTLETNSYYTYSIFMKGDSGGEILELAAIGITGGGGLRQFTLTTSWEKYSLSFVTATDVSGTLYVRVPSGTSTLYIDDVSLIRLDDVDADTETKQPMKPLTIPDFQIDY